MSKFYITASIANLHHEVIFKGTKADMEERFVELKNENRYGHLDRWADGTVIDLCKSSGKDSAGFDSFYVMMSRFVVEHTRTKQARIFSLVVKTLHGFEVAEKDLKEEFAGAIQQFGARHALSQYMARVLQAENLAGMVKSYVNMPRYMHMVAQEESGSPVENISDEMGALAQELDTVVEMATSALLQASDAVANNTNAVGALADQMTLQAKASIRREMKSLRTLLTNTL